MLTKARLDQYIKDNELVPIGTELITVQGGVGKVISNTYGRSSVYLCEFVNGPQLSYTKEFKYIEDNIHTSLIDPTPSTVESPFSKEELEVIIGAMEIGHSANRITREVIHAKANHLLTNANEWPKEMLVGDHESILKPCNVIYADPMNRFFVTKDEGDSDYYTWKICRPIEQKPKELSEIIKPKQKCYCIEAFSRYNFMDEAIFCEIFDDKVYIRKAGEEESKWITVSHFNSSFTLNPTPEQITAAEEAAINEVKERFDGLRKGGKGEK